MLPHLYKHDFMGFTALINLLFPIGLHPILIQILYEWKIRKLTPQHKALHKFKFKCIRLF